MNLRDFWHEGSDKGQALFHPVKPQDRLANNLKKVDFAKNRNNTLPICSPPLHQSSRRWQAKERMGQDNREPCSPKRVEETKQKQETKVLAKPSPKILNCSQEQEAIVNNFPHFHDATLGLTNYPT